MGLFNKLFRRSYPAQSPFERGEAIVVPFVPPNASRTKLAPEATLRDRIEAALDEVRPYLQGDGGDIEIVNLRPDGVVEMHFVGACHG